MYDPSVGRWLTEDPIGFEAGDANLYRYGENSPTNATDPTFRDSSWQNPAMQRQQRLEEMLRMLEADRLHRQFPQGIGVWLNRVRDLQNMARINQADVRTEENKLEQMKKVKDAEKNGEIKDLMDNQISLQQRLVSLQKAALARRTQEIALVNDVSKLDTTDKGDARIYAEKELQFLRLLEDDENWLNQIVEARRQLRDATAAVNKALNPPKK